MKVERKEFPKNTETLVQSAKTRLALVPGYDDEDNLTGLGLFASRTTCNEPRNKCAEGVSADFYNETTP